MMNGVILDENDNPTNSDDPRIKNFAQIIGNRYVLLTYYIKDGKKLYALVDMANREIRVTGGYLISTDDGSFTSNNGNIVNIDQNLPLDLETGEPPVLNRNENASQV